LPSDIFEKPPQISPSSILGKKANNTSVGVNNFSDNTDIIVDLIVEDMMEELNKEIKGY